MKLIDDVRDEWRKFSTWITMAGAAAFGTLTAFPPLATEVWNQLPQDMRENIPHQQTIAALLFGAILVVKFIKQKVKSDDAG